MVRSYASILHTLVKEHGYLGESHDEGVGGEGGTKVHQINTLLL